MVKKSLVALIRFYQAAISPFLGQNCRFYPTCSHYSKEAIETHGAIKGLFLSAFRILKCGPWHKGGYDPVPPLKNKKTHKK